MYIYLIYFIDYQSMIVKLKRLESSMVMGINFLNHQQKRGDDGPNETSEMPVNTYGSMCFGICPNV